MNTKKLMALGLAALMALVIIGPTIVQAKKDINTDAKAEQLPETKGFLVIHGMPTGQVHFGDTLNIYVTDQDGKFAKGANIYLYVNGELCFKATQIDAKSISLSIPPLKPLASLWGCISTSLDGYIGAALLFPIYPKTATLSKASSIR